MREKVKNKKIIMLAVVVILLFSGLILYGRQAGMREEKMSAAVEIKQSTGQELVLAKLISINGNEVTYAVAEEVTESFLNKSDTHNPTSDREMPDMSQVGGENMPDMSQMGGENMPDMGQPSGENMPNMGQPSGGNMPDMSQPGGNGKMQDTQGKQSVDTDTFVYGEATYCVGKEEVTAYIPVGTDVTTKLGTVTTFARLAAGDYLALILQESEGKSVISAVYIIG